MEMLEEKRENWGTRGGFVLAAVGSAVGLGNLWGFPYKLYSCGGGAFLIPYVAAMFCIGIPLLILEFSLGHFTQRAAPNAFRMTHKRHEFVGWWGILLGVVLVTYYPVILAYCLSFMHYSWQSIVHGTALPWAGEGSEGVDKAIAFFKETYLTQGPSIGPFQQNILISLIIAWALMYLCIFKGVNAVGKIVWITVPLPWLILAILTVRGLTLPGSMKGLVYYLDPVWSQLAKPMTWRLAFSQVFFSLSLSFGVMLTYASFLHRKSDINNNAAIIGLADFATSFIAGLAIFSTLGAMAFATSQGGTEVAVKEVVKAGPDLAFVAFPYALAQLPGAAWWSLLFFFTLVTLGIDSAFSITESVLAGIVDKTGWPRWLVLPVMSLIGLAFGLIYVTQNGLSWLGTIDGFVNGTWGIAFLGLLECVVLGWLYNLETLRKHANERSDWSLGRWWNYAIRVFIPIVLGTLFMWSLYDDLTAETGFLKNPQSGEWNIQNCVGMAVIAAVPIISVIMSLIRSRLRSDDEDGEIMNPAFCRGRVGGAILFVMAVVAAGTLIVLVNVDDLPGPFSKYLVFQSLGLALVALIASNVLLEKHMDYPKHPSNFVRWAGIVATICISGCLAIVVIDVTQKAATAEASQQVVQPSEETPESAEASQDIVVERSEEVAEAAKAEVESVEKKPDKLSGVAYVILSVVLLLIFLGLGWCFYRAMTAGTADAPEQRELDGENRT